MARWKDGRRVPCPRSRHFLPSLWLPTLQCADDQQYNHQIKPPFWAEGTAEKDSAFKELNSLRLHLTTAKKRQKLSYQPYKSNLIPTSLSFIIFHPKTT